MPREYGDFRARLERWLRRFGFDKGDPFALHEADQERSYLPFFFVDRPYLHDILGDPAHPQAAFLIAGRGAGKTATREMVAYECTHARLRRRALPVRYYDFRPLLEQVDGDLTRLGVRHHVRVIVRYTLKAVAEEIPATYFDLLGEMERVLLMSYVEAFADPISRLKLARVLPNDTVPVDWNDLTPLETLGTLAELVTRLGRSPDGTYNAVYILVDRVNETAAGPEAAVPLLEPLVSEGPVLEMAHVAFKFFIPIEVGERLQQAVTLRRDRLCVRTITWDEAALQRMIHQRLVYYSDNRVEHLGDLCTPGARSRVLERLIEACNGSPRTLLRLCEALIHHHVASANETNALISHTELVDTLREFQYQLEVEHDQLLPIREGTRAAQMASEPSEKGLYVDESGHVWVDGERVTPSLSDLEFRLLEALYRQSPEIVPHEALIEAVWHPSISSLSDEDESSYAMDEQNLRKLIARLRERLPGERSRFVKNVRGRGYWVKRD